jgi:hypothetical protein
MLLCKTIFKNIFMKNEKCGQYSPSCLIAQHSSTREDIEKYFVFPDFVSNDESRASHKTEITNK